MKCPNCGHINDVDAAFCEKCGTNLRTPSGMSTLTKALIVAVIVLVGILGVVGGMMIMGNQTTPVNNTTIVVNQPVQETSAEWHQIDSFSGVNNEFRTINTKGNKFKVVMTATPVYNNATNYLTIDILKGNQIINTGSLSWGPNDPVTSKENTLEVTTSPGTYTLKIYAIELERWTITIYDYY